MNSVVRKNILLRWLRLTVSWDRAGNLMPAIIIVLAIVAAIGIAVINYKNTLRTLTDLEMNRKREVARLMSALVQERLSSIRRLGVTLALRPVLLEKINQGDWASAVQAVQGITRAFDFVGGVLLVDPQAVIQADMPQMQLLSGTSLVAQEWYQAVRQTWQPYLGALFSQTEGAGYGMLDLAIPVKVKPDHGDVLVDPFDPQGKVVAILVLQIKLNNIAQWIAALNLHQGEVVYVVDQRGHVAYHSKLSFQGQVVDFSAVSSVRKLLHGESGVELVDNPVEKTRRLSAFERVNEFGWGVVLAQSADEFFAERERQQADMLIVYGIFFVACMFFIYWLVLLLLRNDKITQEMLDLYDNAPCGYHSLEDDGTYMRINDTELNWLGYTREEVVGKIKFPDLLIPADRLKFQAEWPRFKERGWVYGFEVEMRRKDGTTFPIYLNSVVVRTADGKFLRTRAVIFNTAEREKMAKAVVESERRFRLLSETSLLGILIIQDRMVKYANPSMLKMLGYLYTELVGLDPTQIIHTEDRGRILENARKMMAGEESQAKYEVRLISKDRRIICFEAFEVRIDYEGRPAVSVNFLDITERKQMAEELRVKNVLLTCQAEASIDGLLAVDEKSKIISFNRRFVDMWRVPPEAITSEDDEPVLKWVTSCVADQEAFLKKVLYLYEHRTETSRDELLLQDGRVFDRYSSPMIGTDAKYYGRVWYFRDITDKYRFEERLRRAAYEWRRTFDSITDFMFLLDTKDRIVQVNAAFYNALGVPPQDIVGKRCNEIDGKGYFLPKWPVHEILKDGKAHTEAVQGSNGIPFWITISPVFDNQQSLAGAVFVARDISVQKAAEKNVLLAYEELQKTQDKLVQSEKLASIGQLAAGVAHELNNPVGFISSNIEVLANYIGAYLHVIRLLDKAQEALGREDYSSMKASMAEIEAYEKQVNLKYMMNDSGLLLQQSQDGMSRIAKIVADLKNFSREETQWLEDFVQIEDILEQALTIAHNELKYRIELRKNYGATPQVRCNAQKIGQVFLNLVINAAQAIADKGVIEIRTYEKEGYLCVDVSDTGCGIPPENMKRIFDPFFTTKPAGQGTGLGLSISYDIVKKQKGDLVVSSEVGKGTTFTLMLPLSK